MVEMEKVFEFEKAARVDLLPDGTLYVNGARVAEGVSSIQIWTEGRYPIGMIRKSGVLYHVIRLKIKQEGYAVAEVKTKRR